VRNHALQSRPVIAVVVALLLNACAVTGDWQQRADDDGVRVYLREYPGSDLPEFRAQVTINATVSQVMMVLTDFQSYPRWVYQCESVTLIESQGYTEAWLYQVNDLPLISDRDMIVHGIINSAGTGKKVSIELQAAPDYCTNNDADVCQQIRDSDHVRVRDASGHFTVEQQGDDQARVTWQQFLDPGGALPHWLVRLMVTRVPMQSLQQLKSLVESG